VLAGLGKAADAIVELCVLLGLFININIVNRVFYTSFYYKVKMQLPAAQSISSSATNTNFNFLIEYNTSYFGSVRICMPKIALEIAEQVLPASGWLSRPEDSVASCTFVICNFSYR
jgi:hypothetical protein